MGQSVAVFAIPRAVSRVKGSPAVREEGILEVPVSLGSG